MDRTAVCAMHSGSRCPYYSGRYAIPGYNDLEILNKLLVAEWDYDKTGDALPKVFIPESKKKSGGNAKKNINGELPFLAGAMVQDVHMMWENCS